MVLGALGLWLMLNVEIFHDEDCDPCIPVLVDFQVLHHQLDLAGVKECLKGEELF